LRGRSGAPPNHRLARPVRRTWEVPSRNAANPMTGSGMQQARTLRAEETVEVVRNHEDGTGFGRWSLPDRSLQRCRWEWTLGGSHPARFGESGSVEGCTALVSALRRKPRMPEARAGRIPREEVGGPTRAAGRSSAGEPRPRGSARFHSPRGGWSRRGAVGIPRRPARRRARSGRGRGSPTTRYDHAADIASFTGFGKRHARPLKAR